MPLCYDTWVPSTKSLDRTYTTDNNNKNSHPYMQVSCESEINMPTADQLIQVTFNSIESCNDALVEDDAGGSGSDDNYTPPDFETFAIYPLGVCVSNGKTSFRFPGCGPADANTGVSGGKIVEYSDPECKGTPVNSNGGTLLKPVCPTTSASEDRGTYHKSYTTGCLPSFPEYPTEDLLFKSVHASCVIARPRLTANPTSAPTSMRDNSPPIVVEILVSQELTGITKEQFNDDAQRVFKKTVIIVLGLPLDNEADIDKTIKINDYSDKIVARRRLGAGSVLVVDYTIIIRDAKEAGFSTPEEAFQAMKAILTKAITSGSFTETLVQVALQDNVPVMTTVSADTPPVMELRPQPTEDTKSKPKKVAATLGVGAIVGIVLGSIAFVCILVFLYFKYFKNATPSKGDQQRDFSPIAVVSDENK